MNAKELKETRKKLGLTQAELAELVGVSPRTIQGWEYGDQKVSKPVEQFLKQQLSKRIPSEGSSLYMDVSGKDKLYLEEMAEFCLKNVEEFVNIPGIKLLIDYNRNQAKAELLEKHIILRNQEEGKS